MWHNVEKEGGGGSIQVWLTCGTCMHDPCIAANILAKWHNQTTSCHKEATMRVCEDSKAGPNLILVITFL